VQLQKQEKTNSLNLFLDIKNRSIRTRNQAVMMANLFEDNLNKSSGSTSDKGAASVLYYFTQVPEDDKQDVLTQYKSIMCERGFEEVK
jgi:hypothetical protein